MRNEKISVIVPIYKVENELERCLQSILKQTYAHLEIILVDDESPDKCPEICDYYAKQDTRVIVIHKENGGLSDARNAGLKVATGDYVLYVDSDDYIELNACEKLIQYATDDVDFIVGACREVHKKSVKYQKHTNITVGKLYTAKDFAIESIKKGEWFAPAWLNMYKRQFLIDNELYYKKGIVYEDMQMLPRLYLAATKIVYSDFCFYNYIIREGSIMTSGKSLEKRNMSLAIYKEWFELLHNVEDEEYKRYLSAALVRHYLASSRLHEIKEWTIPGFDFKFAMKYALGIKDKIKVLAFTLFPEIYVKI
ncbi:glycosyltransferase [Blautia sp. AF25-12LB]|nr:glycosyltransferase [Blautia sp. AF25-12LB]